MNPKFSIYSNDSSFRKVLTNALLFIGDVGIYDGGAAHLEEKQKFLSSTSNLVVHISDTSGISMFFGALRKLIDGKIDSLIVLCDSDVRELLIYGENNETEEATKHINAGALIWLPTNDIEEFLQLVAQTNNGAQ